MRRALQFAGALAAAVLLHLLGAHLVDHWSLIFDLMLIVVVFNALDGSPLAAMFGGLAAGWATDALAGPSYGVFGLVDTIIGYGAALVVQRIVIHRAAGAALFFAAAAAVQQGLLLGLNLLMLDHAEITDFRWMFYKAATTGFLGAILFVSRQRVLNRMDLWRHTRKTRIRLDR